MSNQSKPTLGSRRAKLEYWQCHIRDWNESGLSQTQYCRENQLKLPTFQYWKSKFERQSLTTPLLPVTLKTLTSSTTRSLSSGISISVNHHISIQLETCFNRETLIEVLDLLESR